MSCQSCSGCFTGSSCSTTKISKKDALNDSIRFQSLLEMAAESKDLQLASSKVHDHVIPTIMSELSKNIYSSQTTLFQAYDTLSLEEFLSLSSYLYQYNIVGAFIAWAFEHCQNDPHKLLQILKTSDDGEKTKLAEHCNDQAEIHELFGQSSPGSMGRITIK